MPRPAFHSLHKRVEAVGSDLLEEEVAEHVAADRADKADVRCRRADLRQVHHKIDRVAAQPQLDRLGEVLDHARLSHAVEAGGG